jgi:hypothetical protein
LIDATDGSGASDAAAASAEHAKTYAVAARTAKDDETS